MGEPFSTRTCWRAPSVSEAVFFYSRYRHEFIPHTHEATTLLIVTDGAVEVGIGAGRYVIGAGQFAIIGANQVHWARPAALNGWEMRSLHLPLAEIASTTGISADECARMHFLNPVHPIGSVGSMFLDLHHSTGGKNPTRLDLSAFVKDLYAKIDTFGPTILKVSSPDERVVMAKKILTECIAESTQIGDIAEEVGLSVFSLIRQFERAFGISPHGWRIQARANEAARLLRGSMEAAATAAHCGFSDQSHMVRIFKKVFGITPGQYSMLH